MEEIHLFYYGAVNRFKSVRRAIKRGKVSITGTIFPSRPFNNRKHSPRTRDKLHRLVMEAYQEAKNSKLNGGK